MPRPAQRGEYAAASEFISQRLLSLPGVTALYRTGHVGAPGISDLDLIAVVNELHRQPAVWETLPERVRYLAMHSPFLVDRESFADHRWFAHLDPLDLIAGDEVPHNEPPQADLLACLLGVEGLVVLRLSLEKQRFNGRIKARPTLCELNGLRHSLRLTLLDERAAEAAWRSVENTSELRADWWDLGEPERRLRLTELVSETCTAIDEALAAVAVTHPPTGTVDKVLLAGPWQWVVLDPGRTVHFGAGALLPRVLTSGSGRLSEARWRLTRHRLHIPAAIAVLLHEAASSDAGVLWERRKRVLRYERFMSLQAASWSRIGVARVFTR